MRARGLLTGANRPVSHTVSASEKACYRKQTAFTGAPSPAVGWCTRSSATRFASVPPLLLSVPIALSEPLLPFCSLSRSRSAAFHMPQLLFAQRFVLGFLLTKISAGRRSDGLFHLRWLTSARKEATQKIHKGHGCQTRIWEELLHKRTPGLAGTGA